jgi:hypothetical protein
VRHIRALEFLPPSASREAGTAWIVHIACAFLCTVGDDFIEPIDQLGVAAAMFNQAVQSITAVASTLVASDPQKIELANQINEGNCTIAGASRAPRGWLSLPNHQIGEQTS